MKSQVFLFGLDHHTAPLAVRESLALTGDGLRLALKFLKEQKESGVKEAAILSTCNRQEFYLAAETYAQADHQFFRFIKDFFGITPGQIRKYVYEKTNASAFEHLMRVASGLESIVLGEPQILGQVTRAYSKAHSQQVSGLILNRLFEQAIRAGKRARAETDISRHTTSVSHVAAALAHEKLCGLHQAHVLLIGAGEMAAQARDALHHHGARRFVCVSRTLAHAEHLMQPVHGRAVNWLELPTELVRADLVISATAAPHPILHVANIAPILPQRNEHSLVMIDIAVPRDIEEAVGTLPGIEVYNVDGLRNTVDEHLALRRAAIPQVETIIAEECAAFQAWQRSRQVTPTIIALRHKAETIALQEVNKTLRLLGSVTPETRQAAIRLSQNIVQKLLHEPTTQLKAVAQDEDYLVFARTIWQLFALEDCNQEEWDD